MNARDKAGMEDWKILPKDLAAFSRDG